MDDLKARLGVNKLIPVLGYAAEMDRKRKELFFPYSRIRRYIRQFVEEIHKSNYQEFGFITGRDLAGVMAFFNFYAHMYSLKRCFIAPEGAPISNSQSRNVGTFFRRFEVLNISLCVGPNNSKLIPQYKITSNDEMLAINFAEKNESAQVDVRWGSECPFLFSQSNGCIFFGGGKIAETEEIPLAIKKAKEDQNYKIIIVKGCKGVSDAKIEVLDEFRKQRPFQIYYAKNGKDAAQYFLKYL